MSAIGTSVAPTPIFSLNPSIAVIRTNFSWGDLIKKNLNGIRHTYDFIYPKELERLRSISGPAIPTMCIHTVKLDSMGGPDRAKSRIVVLGNHEWREWSKSDCYAPVCTAKDYRLLLSLAVNRFRHLKQGDIKNAFCNGDLPPDETVVCKPPAGCPYTPKGSYWLLKKTLYGLRRSPKHWYDKFVSLLAEIGLHPCLHSPCVFSGTIIPGEPKIYLAVYVDDFVFFSESDEVEKNFNKNLNLNAKLLGWE